MVIQLTLLNNKTIYINSKHIIAYSGTDKHTEITLTNGVVVDVREAASRIAEMLGKQYD